MQTIVDACGCLVKRCPPSPGMQPSPRPEPLCGRGLSNFRTSAAMLLYRACVGAHSLGRIRGGVFPASLHTRPPVCVCVCVCAKESIRICSNCEVQQS